MLLPIMLVLIGCRSGGAPPPGYLQVDIDTSPLALDPRLGTDAMSSRIGELVFNALVRVDEHDQFAGDLAASIERPMPTVIVFHLRPGLRFSDGRSLTARDVKFTYDSILAPGSISPKAAMFSELAAVDAPDDTTVVFRMHHPYAPALEMATVGVVPAGTPIGHRGASAASLGSGPFAVESFVRDERVILRRNPYRSAAPGAPRGIVFKIVPDPTVRALELAEGICDFAENNIEPNLLGYLEKRPALVIERFPGTTYQYLAFNFRDPRLKDLRVRRAIAYALDRRAIVDHLRYRTARVATGMLSPENAYYFGDVKNYPYDPDRADALLDQAGYPRGLDGWRRLEFVYKTTPEGQRLGEAFQAMLGRVGIRLRIRVNEFGTFYGDIQRGNFDLMSLQWVGITDPHQYRMVFDSRMTPPRGLNRGAYANPAMDRLVTAGDSTLDPSARRAVYRKVQQLAADDLPYVSLWWQDNVVVMKRSLGGFRPYPNGSLRSLAEVTIGPRALAERGP